MNKRPLSGDIRNLDDVITIHIPEEIVQKQKDELDNIALPTVKHNVKHKYHNLFKDGNNSGPIPLQNKYFSGEMFECAITTSNACTKRVNDDLIAHKELDQLLTNNEATVRLKQKEVIPLTEFVKIKKTRFTGARLFSTIFQQEYIESKWTFRHDITGYITVREKKFNQNDRMKYLMWRSDGLPTSHPIFVLVFYNHRVRNQLHKLGSVCINTEGINPYITLPDLKQLWSNDDDRKTLQRKLFTFASKLSKQVI